jgi:hypothetical protein
MRAMSLKLVTGTIDGVGGTVEVRHVAPRVLTPQEVRSSSRSRICFAILHRMSAAVLLQLKRCWRGGGAARREAHAHAAGSACVFLLLHLSSTVARVRV